MLKSSPIGDMMVELTETDSTNNYAMRLLNEGMAEHGMVVTAQYQTAGKGQHGHQWESDQAHNLLFSVILDTGAIAIDHQFRLNAMTAVTIAEVLTKETEVSDIHIKWPNDIYSGKKKISGILIENHLRGHVWCHTVVGIGINVNQIHFPLLPQATSIAKETGVQVPMKVLLKKFLHQYNSNFIHFLQNPEAFMKDYNQLLYRKGDRLSFLLKEQTLEGILLGVNETGQIELEMNGLVQAYQHREIEILYT